VDLYTPVAQTGPGVVSEYRLKYAANFDGVFATILTAPNFGFIDSNVNRNVIETQPFTGTSVRIVFDPVTYGIVDNKSFWLQFFPVTDGVEGAGGAPTLVLPDEARFGTGIVIIQGSAPGIAPLQLDFPRRVQDLNITNEDGASNLLVGTEDGGPLSAVLPLIGSQNFGLLGAQGSIYVKGDGGPVAFSARFTLAFPR
jgi:hypothetical protein